MDIQDDYENQAADPKDYWELIQEKHIGDTEVFNRSVKTEEPADDELSFIENVYELMGIRLKYLYDRKQVESQHVRALQSQVLISNQECDEMMQKYKVESLKFVKSMAMVDDLHQQKDKLSLLLKESQKELLMEKAEHLRVNEALEAKIKSLQDEHQSEMDTLKRTNQSLPDELNNNKTQSSQEEQWQKKYADLEKTHETKLSNTIQLIKKENQESQKILEEKLKAQLKCNDSLMGELRVSHRDRNESQIEITELRDHIIESRVAAIAELMAVKDERTLLENVCLQLTKKCRGPFGRKMQDREFELEKMKRKMRETQGVTVTKTQMRTQTETETQTETQTEVETELFGGATCSISPERTNESLLEELNNNKITQIRQEEQWRNKYADLENTHEIKLNNTIQLMKNRNQQSQKILNDKLKAYLRRNSNLLEKLGVANRECERLRETQDEFHDISDSINETRIAMAEERTLLEDVCLNLLKRCRGRFGRRMQDREIEIEKLKTKMREKQSRMRAETETETETETEVETELFGGTTLNIDGACRPAPYSLRKRMPHLNG